MDLALYSPWYLTLAWQHWSCERAGQLGPGFGGIGINTSIWRNVAQCLWPGSAYLVTALAILALFCDLGLSTLCWHHAALCLLPLSSSVDLMAVQAIETFVCVNPLSRAVGL